ncbi:MAG TPA: glycine dehydrogenase, partial [Pirellulales bacterium]
ATSNICTNQGLLALRATVYLSLVGPKGLREVAELSLRKANYAAEQITAGGRLSLAFERPTFKEFVVRDRENNVPQLLADARAAGFYAGVPLADWYPQLADCFLIAVTEKRTRAEIDALAVALNSSSAKTTSNSTKLHATTAHA